MKLFSLISICFLTSLAAIAQPSQVYPVYPDNSFYQTQINASRVNDANNRFNKEWQKLCKEKN